MEKIPYLDAKDTQKIHNLKHKIAEANKYCIGYPVSKDFDYSPLFDFLSYPINNIGDPYEGNTYKVQSHELEREVLAFFAQLFRANPKDYWGYVSNGGSESNLYGLYLARELYPKAMVYYSESTHYSVRKNIHLLNIPSIVIRSQSNGEMDYEDLEETLKFNRHKPAIVLCTCGTTMTEAKDDVGQVKRILKGLAIHDHYIHVDAALAGSFAPFMNPRPSFDFKDGADSIAISGHKFIGTAFPAGVLLSKRSYKDKIAKGISYIGSLDTTISGSRNGHNVLFLWYGLKKIGLDGMKKRYENALSTANYAYDRLKELNLGVWKNPGAITLVLPQAPEAVKEKWQLATDEESTHLICMPNVDRAQINEFVEDLKHALKKEKELKLGKVDTYQFAF